MKKICYVNCASGGSTGTLVMQLSALTSDNYHSCFILGQEPIDANGNCLLFSNTKSKYTYHRIGTYLFGNDGFIRGAIPSKIKRFLYKENPDLIHIHNIHRSFSNLPVILKYAKENNKQIVWTLHDEWVLTGRCCSFQECTNWRIGCGNCHRRDLYPKSLFDFSSKFWKYKRELLAKYLDIITFVSPSKWLADLVVDSFRGARVLIIRNGVDQKVFKPSQKDKELISIAKDRLIIGCVADNLSIDKGYDDIVKLSKRVEKNEMILFVIGANSENNIERVNDSLYILKKTSSKAKMASFYSTIDIMFDPTKGDNYPTTHIECLSCGTPVITYDVGGAPEAITDEIKGFVVKKGDLDSTIELLSSVRKKKKNSILIRNNSLIHSFEYCLKQYLELYKSILT